MKKSIIILFLLAILFIGAVIFIQRWKKPTEVTNVRIAYFEDMGWLPYFVAKEKGFFNEVNLNSELIEVDSKQTLNALITNRADVTIATIASVIGMEIEKPGLIKLFGLGGETITGEPVSGVVVLKDSPIQKIDDLKGKTLATENSAYIPAIKLIFKNIGFDPEKDIRIIEVGKEAIAQALIQKQIDAIYSHQPSLTILVNKFDTRIVETNLRAKHIADPYLTSAMGIVTSEFAQKNPETVKKIIDVYDKSIKFIRENPNESKLIGAKYVPIAEDIITKIGLATFISSKEKIDFEKLEQVINSFVDAGILKQKVDVKPMFIMP